MKFGTRTFSRLLTLKLVMQKKYCAILVWYNYCMFIVI